MLTNEPYCKVLPLKLWTLWKSLILSIKVHQFFKNIFFFMQFVEKTCYYSDLWLHGRQYNMITYQTDATIC